ncbi:MAG: glycyl-radical enzyme activating protein [Oscillospiraceae bacterium]|nr:glycyl-radical enzyme activating protein [Oscillospiraceae bacterium]
MKGSVFDIVHCSLVDGPGVRTSVFFKGCNLSCTWCHNPESHSAAPEILYYKDICTGCGACRCEKPVCDRCGHCALVCPTGAKKLSGSTMAAEAVLEEVLSDKVFYGEDGGVTFSGGECMLQREFLSHCLQLCKENGIQTAVDTAGNVPWAAFEAILPYTDLFLYDVKVMDSGLHKRCTGSGNAQILDNLGKLLDAGKRVWVRVPVIPGMNDNKENFLALKSFLQQHPAPEKIELLPYHAMGETKYAALGKTCHPFAVPEKETLDALAAHLDGAAVRR